MNGPIGDAARERRGRVGWTLRWAGVLFGSLPLAMLSAGLALGVGFSSPGPRGEGSLGWDLNSRDVAELFGNFAWACAALGAVLLAGRPRWTSAVARFLAGFGALFAALIVAAETRTWASSPSSSRRRARGCSCTRSCETARRRPPPRGDLDREAAIPDRKRPHPPSPRDRSEASDALGCAFVFVPAVGLRLVMAFGLYWGASPSTGLARETRIRIALGGAAFGLVVGRQWLGGRPRGAAASAAVVLATVALLAALVAGRLDGDPPALTIAGVAGGIILGALAYDRLTVRLV